jgi:sec-independent protein translocase protein TatA
MTMLFASSFSLLAFGMGLGPTEMVIVAAIAVLLFGSRLPEVARSMGKSVVEFKKGLRGVEQEVNSAIYSGGAVKGKSKPASYNDDADDLAEAAAPNFVPPTSAPTPAGPSSAGPSAE